MAGRFSVETVFKAIDRVTAPVTRMQNRVGKFTRSMDRGLRRLDRRFSRLRDGMKSVATAATIGLATTGAAMANVLGAGVDFEQTLVSAAAKFPGEVRRGTAAFNALEEAARRTGSTTEFSASQSAQALNYLAMAGFSAKNSVAALPGVVDLATAAQVDLATATDVASDSLGAFGLMTDNSAQLGKNLARVNDVIARTTTSANTTVESLFETIKDGAPVATTAGASLETFAALAGEMANAGIKGSRAGTTLKNIFLSLSAPTSKAGKSLKRLGVETMDADGNLRDVVDIFGDLGKSLDGMGTAQRSGVLESIFGKIPIAGVNVLLASGSDRLREYRKQLEGAGGAAEDMAATMRDTVRGRLNSFWSAVEGVKISIFSMNRGPLAETIERMTEWVRANEKLIATNVGEFIAKILNNLPEIVKWGKRIGIAVAAFFALTAVLKTFILVMTAVNLVLTANPIGLIVVAVGALIAGIAALIIYWDDVKRAVVEFAEKTFSELSTVEGAIKGLFRVGVKFNPFAGMLDTLFKISDRLGLLPSWVKSWTGLGDNDAADAPGRTGNGAAGVVSPQERVARSIDEQRTTNSAEVTIRDESGRAEQTGGTGPGAGLNLISSGAF